MITMSLKRRDLLAGSTAAAIAMTVWPAKNLFAADTAPTVTIVAFTAAGERQPAAALPKVVMTEAEWKAKLSPASFVVSREAGTERPYSGELLNEHRKGIFRCIGCDTALFDSATHFEPC